MGRGRNVIGMTVKNECGSNRQTGILVEVCNYTVTDPLDFAPSLKSYYVNKGEEYRVKDIPDDTPVVMVKLNNGSMLPCYPQALKPVLTREEVGKLDPDFSLKIDHYEKRNMPTRLKLDQDLIQDIGAIPELSGLEFETECCPSAWVTGKGRWIFLNSSAVKAGRWNAGKKFRCFSMVFIRKRIKN